MKRREVDGAILALNEIMAELVCLLAQGEWTLRKDTAYQIVKTLEENTLALNGSPAVRTQDIADWEGP